MRPSGARTAMIEGMPLPPRARILIDYYHHRPAHLWVGDRAVTGFYHNNLGPYGLQDNYPTTGYFHLHYVLRERCILQEHHAPITAEALVGCDTLVIVNPDYAGYPGHGPAFDDREIAAVHAFVARGGGLLAMVNSFLPVEGDYLWKE